jgi:hypothetical protein
MGKNGFRTLLVVFLATCFIAVQAPYSLAGTTGPCHPTGNAHSSVHPCSGEQHEVLQSGGCCCGDSSAPCDCEVKESRTGDQDLSPVSMPHSTGTNPVGTGITNPHVAVIVLFTDRAPGVGWIQARAPSDSRSLSTVKILC